MTKCARTLDASLFRLDVEKTGRVLVYSPRLHSGCGNRANITHIGRRPRWHQTTAATTTDLPALASRGTGFISCPLVGGAFFMGSAAAFAGDFTLFFGGHRGKAPAFPAFSTQVPDVCGIIHGHFSLEGPSVTTVRTTYGG